MKRLILLRHAKAVGQIAGQDDRDRTLADRGRSDAIRMGQYLREQDSVPELVLCSTALRTRETVDLVVPQLGSTPTVRYMAELYLARWLSIINTIRQVHDTAGIMMVVGHNPGLEDCARKLARPPGDTKGRQLHQLLQAEYPTASLAIFDFEIVTWSAIERGEGELEMFVRPKDLRGPD